MFLEFSSIFHRLYIVVLMRSLVACCRKILEVEYWYALWCLEITDSPQEFLLISTDSIALFLANLTCTSRNNTSTDAAFLWRGTPICCINATSMLTLLKSARSSWEWQNPWCPCDRFTTLQTSQRYQWQAVVWAKVFPCHEAFMAGPGCYPILLWNKCTDDARGGCPTDTCFHVNCFKQCLGNWCPSSSRLSRPFGQHFSEVPGSRYLRQPRRCCLHAEPAEQFCGNHRVSGGQRICLSFQACFGGGIGIVLPHTSTKYVKLLLSAIQGSFTPNTLPKPDAKRKPHFQWISPKPFFAW